MMPYPSFRQMSDEDVQAVVAFLSTLPPVRNPLSKTQIDFPVAMLIKSAPHPAGSVPSPDRKDKLKYGEYLVTLAGCAGCHTREEKGQPVPGMRFAGGREFRMPTAIVVTANIK